MANVPKSSWAPFAIGALVVLIILCAIYYYYYRKDTSCIEGNVKKRFPGADPDFIKALTARGVQYSVTLKKGETCPAEYNQISDGDDSCTICEMKDIPLAGPEIMKMWGAWANTPQGAAAIKSLPKTGFAAAPSPSS
jgi:hypothetical protein